ncbi:HAD family phosphatase [Luteolibacter flavescens]|uniref:HAD family phosphatase n=1 Tax=Luteolibacter flavescens TaxID=1859460 RepID=A0ABT3FIW1_9BACT|nr:HAD family phosphatase [Luteolibacter flavescens]MCW1883493.1 HAD family phosphatase [Luteolibacter flavescens]
MTFLFDIGKVILDFHFEPSLAKLLPPGTENGPERLSVLLEKKDDFEGGRISLAEYVPWAIERLGSAVSDEDFVHAWRNIFTPNLAMWRVIESLAAGGHRLILFSNTNGIHCPWIFENYEIFRHFPEAVLSYEAGSIKPEPEIYHHAIATYGLKPQETRYIDDLPANIETGRTLGFRSWQYDLNDHAAFERWLAAEMMHG